MWVGGWFVDVGGLHLCCISTATCMVYTCTLLKLTICRQMYSRRNKKVPFNFYCTFALQYELTSKYSVKSLLCFDLAHCFYGFESSKIDECL